MLLCLKRVSTFRNVYWMFTGKITWPWDLLQNSGRVWGECAGRYVCWRECAGRARVGGVCGVVCMLEGVCGSGACGEKSAGRARVGGGVWGGAWQSWGRGSRAAGTWGFLFDQRRGAAAFPEGDDDAVIRAHAVPWETTGTVAFTPESSAAPRRGGCSHAARSAGSSWPLGCRAAVPKAPGSPQGGGFCTEELWAGAASPPPRRPGAGPSPLLPTPASVDCGPPPHPPPRGGLAAPRGRSGASLRVGVTVSPLRVKRP